MNFLLELGLGIGDVPTIINDALRTLMAWLCEFIYPWIAYLYELFRTLGKVAYNENFTVIYDKISLLIGIFMVFRVTFWLIELLVNPDGTSDKEKKPGKIIQKVLVAIVLLATTPTIFKMAFNIQSIIIDKGVIENVISLNKAPYDVTNVGRKMSAELFVNFYTKNIDENGGYDKDCDSYTERDGIHYSDLINTGKFSNLNGNCLTARFNDNKEKGYVIDFNGIFAVGVGGFILWMILMYCISLGVRYAQLIYLQVIAPIPIMCYLAPGKDNMFSKWVKQCTTTYLDLFIRVAIISFVMLLSQLILQNENNVILNSIGGEQNGLIKVFLVIGLLTFAKKAPELIQELLPKSATKASGDFGLSLKKRSESMLGGKFAYSTLKRAPGYAAGGLLGAAVGGTMGAMGGKGVGSRIMGGLSGAARGFGTGSKKGSIIKNIGEVKKNQASANSKLQQWRIAAGKGEDEANTWGDYWSRKGDAFKKSMGFETEGQYFERGKSSAKSATDAYQSGKKNSIDKAIEKQTKARAFGYGSLTLTQLDQNRKSAQQAVDSNDKSTLLFDEAGQKRLKNFFVSKGGSADYFDKLSLVQKEKFADKFVEHLQKQSDDANEAYNSKEKEFGFIYQIEQAFGIKRDQNGDVSRNADGSIKSEGASEEYINYFTAINNFISEYDEEFGITSEENGLFKSKIKYRDAQGQEHETEVPTTFDPKEMAKYMADAESNSQTSSESRAKLKAIYENWDMIKTLQSRVATVERDPKHAYHQANDKFNS